MDVAENAEYKRTLVKSTYKKSLNQFNNIQSAQKENSLHQFHLISLLH